MKVDGPGNLRVGGVDVSATNPVPKAYRRGNEIHVHKFGARDLASGTLSTVWGGTSAMFPWSHSAGVVTVTSDDAGDNAHVWEVQGIADSDGSLTTEQITLDATATPTGTGSTSFRRIFRMRLITGETDGSHAGGVSATIGGTQVAAVIAGYGQSTLGVYEVPSGYQAWVSHVDYVDTSAKTVEFRFRVRPYSTTPGSLEGWQVKDFTPAITDPLTNDYSKNEADYEAGLGPYGAGSQMEVQATAAGAGTSVSCRMHIVLEPTS